ncbi:MAG TPA: amino acid permease [Vicinamibacterales bacterium]|jgi:amino acid transporter|nr:amino acid permease [Vicinamibacterales bacterium]
MQPHLDRGMGLLQATATNMLAMIGVGPFLTIPFMVTAMGGPHILYAWTAGLVLALCDGLVFAQFGAALPGSGGPYLYLREAYKPFGFGRLLSFLFIFQTIAIGPLGVASGAVGFADYLGFSWTTMPPAAHHAIAAAVCVLMTALLYRHISGVGRFSVVLLSIVLVTVGWVIVVGLFRFSPSQAFAYSDKAFVFDRSFFLTLGAASILAMYDYGGYNQICNIGEEVRSPDKTIPRAILVSIIAVALLYMLMGTVIIGVIPWQDAAKTRTIASMFIERTFSDPGRGHVAGLVMMGLILFVTASSLYSVILGYSRIPFAAARDGQFFAVFARVHPTKHFPYVSLITIGALAIPFCFLSLGQIVNWLIQVQVFTQFVWQCAGVILLRRYRTDIPQPFTMWLYPVPAIVSGALWVYVFVSGPVGGMIFSAGFLAAGVAAYYGFHLSKQDDAGGRLA